MNSDIKKSINNLLRNITDGDYSKAKDDVSTIIEKKIVEQIKKISPKQSKI